MIFLKSEKTYIFLIKTIVVHNFHSQKPEKVKYMHILNQKTFKMISSIVIGIIFGVGLYLLMKPGFIAGDWRPKNN